MKIKELIINTQHLAKQVAFYQKLLGFQLVSQTKNAASFRIGASVLTFHEKERSGPYHFAFNIPYGKELEALKWLKKRVKVLSFEQQEIIDFVNWRAKAIYFYDPEDNIVEFIARKAIGIDEAPGFNSDKVLNISEVGLPTLHIEALYQEINTLRPIEIFYGDFEAFCALGDDEGLFIVVNSSKKTWFPCGDKVHPANLAVRGDYNFEFHHGKLKELV